MSEPYKSWTNDKTILEQTRSAKADGQSRVSSEFRPIVICIHGILTYMYMIFGHLVLPQLSQKHALKIIHC